MKSATPTTPSRPTTPISPRQAIGERVDERHHGRGGEIQKRGGAIRVVEDIAERPGERFEVWLQARGVLLWEGSKQGIVLGRRAETCPLLSSSLVCSPPCSRQAY